MKKTIKSKRMTVDVEPELHLEFKIAAAKAGVLMRDVLLAAIRKFVAKETK